MQKKILVIANGTIGDIVTAMPAMKKICSFHRGDIVHLYNTRIVKNDIHKTLFDHLDCFDKMNFKIVSDSLYRSIFRRLANWWSIYREHYDVIYELPGNFLIPIKMLKAFGTEKIYSLEKIEPAGVPRYRYLLQMLEAFGIPRCKDDENIDWNNEDISNAIIQKGCQLSEESIKEILSGKTELWNKIEVQGYHEEEVIKWFQQIKNYFSE